MKAVVCSEYGPIEQLELQNIQEPVLQPGSLRVKMTVASVNPPDILMPQGLYQVKPPVPFIPGIEGAGVVLETAPDVSGFAPGDRVMMYAGQGCFAEQNVVPAYKVCQIPSGMTDEAASGFVLAYSTVYHALIDCGQLAPGENVVLLGAAGGLGLCAIQIAKAVGARVIAVASTPEKREKCLKNGADEVLEPDVAKLRNNILALTNGLGADVILDIVGGDITDAALRAIRPYGRFVIAGYASGHVPAIKANLILLKQARVIGASYRLLLQNQPDQAAANLTRLCDMWSRGLLQPEVTMSYAFDDFLQALRLVRDRKVIGKAALSISV